MVKKGVEHGFGGMRRITAIKRKPMLRGMIFLCVSYLIDAKATNQAKVLNLI